MRESFKNSIAFFGNLLPLSMLRAGANFPPFLPFYHLVSDHKPEYINSYVVRSSLEFEKELDYLLKHFKPVDLKTIIQSPQKNQMHLTFDDGLKECYSVIAPILKRKGIPSTFFVSPDFIDNKKLFHRFKRTILISQGLLKPFDKKYFIHESHFLDEVADKNGKSFSDYLTINQPYMTMEEILSLQSDGFTIGSHSLNHPEFWTLHEDEQYRQIEESVQWVVDRFQPEIKAFSFPFTDDQIRLSLFERLRKNNVVDITFGTAGLKSDQVSFNLQRIPIERSQNWDARKVIHFEYLYYFTRSILGKNKVNRQ
jgi:peptidoglycan/xylan/chitin deacetylase (PgdA/CDA1 family)